MNYPKEVKTNIKFLTNKNIWHILSTNPKVVSCGDAASKRKRLGNIGIPIFDELKSELGFFVNKKQEKQKVLVHCRGNQKLDRLKISSILNSEYQRITDKSESKGLINPFGKEFRNLLQIFDISTRKKFHPPYTMMTNAGDFKYALEFHVECLINSLPDTIVDDVIRYDNYNQFIKHKIGILTGNGPDSGILLWSKINESVKEKLKSRLNHSFRGDLSYPEVLIESIPEMGISMELQQRESATEEVVIKGILNLCQRGATIIAVACNTTQFFKERIANICELYGAEFISIAEVTNDYLIENDIKEFDLLGVSHVADFTNYSSFKDLGNNYKVSLPETENEKKKLDDIAFLVKKNEINKASNLLKDLIKRNTTYETKIIALTEISSLRSIRKDIMKIDSLKDSLDFLADNLSDRYVNGIFETLYIDKEKDTISYDLVAGDSKELIKNELWNILCEVDYEFIPPLSFRDSTTFSFGNNLIEKSKPKKYFKNLLKQEIIVSRKTSNNAVTGFMSYIPNHLIDHDSYKLKCYYITTIGVTKGERGNGITKNFYKKIEEEVSKQEDVNWVATRTWSTNRTHIRILINLGYKKVIEIKDDRAPGIHTVYYAKEIKQKIGS